MLLTDTYPLVPDSKKSSRIGTVDVRRDEAAEIRNDSEFFEVDKFLPNESDGVFFVRVSGDSAEMEIFDGDLLIVNCRLAPNDGDKILALLNGCLTTEIFRQSPTLQLIASNGRHLPEKNIRKDDFQMLGVITHVVHSLRDF